MSEGKKAMIRSQERPASTSNGYLMLLLWLALIPWTIVAFLSFGVAVDGPEPAALWPLWLVGWIGGLILFLFVLFGFFMIQPNMSAVITLFGAYRGTERTSGL